MIRDTREISRVEFRRLKRKEASLEALKSIVPKNVGKLIAEKQRRTKKVSKKTKMAGATILIAVFVILTSVHTVYAAPIKFKLPWDLDYTYKLVQETISELRKKEAENEHKTGDLNGDGEVDIQDVIRLRKYITNPENPDYQIDKEAADINKDGKINSTDVLLLRKMI